MPNIVFTVNLNGTASNFNSMVKGAQSSLQNLQQAGISAGSGVTNALGGISGALKGILALNLLSFITELASKALDFIKSLTEGLIGVGKSILETNQHFQDMQYNLATVLDLTGTVTNMSGKVVTGQEKFNAALGISKDIQKELFIQASMHVGKIEEYTATYTQLMGAVAGTSKNQGDVLKNNLDLTIKTVSAYHSMANLMPQGINQAMREVMFLIEGRKLGPRNVLQTHLHISNDDLQKWKDQGSLLENVSKRMEVYNTSSAEQAHTMTGLLNTLNSVWQLFQLMLGSGLYENIQSFLQRVVDKLFIIKNGVRSINPMLQNLADNIQEIFTPAVNAAQWLISNISTFIAENQPLMFQLGEMVDTLLVNAIISVQTIFNSITQNKDVMQFILALIIEVSTYSRFLVQFYAMEIPEALKTIYNFILPIGNLIEKIFATAKTELDMLTSDFKIFIEAAKTGHWGGLGAAINQSDTGHKKGLHDQFDDIDFMTKVRKGEGPFKAMTAAMLNDTAAMNTGRATLGQSPFFANLNKTVTDPSKYRYTSQAGFLLDNPEEKLKRLSPGGEFQEFLSMTKKLGAFPEISAGNFRTTTSGQQEVTLNFNVGDQKEKFTANMSPQELASFKAWALKLQGNLASHNYVQENRNYSTPPAFYRQ